MKPRVKLPTVYTMGALPARFSLVTSEAQWKKVFKHLRVKETHEWLLDGACATTTTLHAPGEKPHILVAYDPLPWPDCDDPHNRACTAALLAHEAVHVVRSVMDYMREEAPGEEVVAYAVQHVTSLLLMELWGE